MNDWKLNAQAAILLAEEGNALDTKDWDRWLDLFHEDIRFWMPAWKNETEQTSNPDSEMSLLYFESRASMEDRIWRLRTGKSIASRPLLRTAHATSHVLAQRADNGLVDIEASWTCHTFNAKRQIQHVYFGRYEYRVATIDDRWRIREKKVILLNDYIPTFLDIYCI